MAARILSARGRTLDLSSPKIMGILNVTPDSFSDGGKFVGLESAVEQARRMVNEGADIIDIGGESTRPGADLVPVEEELRRVVPVVKAIASELDVMISVDTSTPEVMEQCVEAGAHLWNDIRALQRDGAVDMAAKLDVGVCLMHMQGDPKTMQINPVYTDVVKEVTEFLRERAKACTDAGISEDKIILDPGFGFGKTLKENYQLLNHLPKLIEGTNFHLLSALSRKSMVGVAVTGITVPAERVVASVTAAFYSFMQGAHMVRVHDVKETKEALQVFNAIKQYN
ncbi:dihydropteroate synthase [Anaerobiospirillum succiniciproducens]|uniref:dihydropteroate synthase n=1 Tax=Anaerobiospirillum succiniciproducens TaxID=13335 RepID=UPI002942F0C2|nr:dihydropteroate synthase [Anaerobiospirillum succiniciproducens]